MAFEAANVFITGGAGFIGANFVRRWLKVPRAGQVVVFDSLTYAGNLENLSGLEHDARYVFVKGDICDEGLVHEICKRYEIDTIVHFAAESHVDRSILGPDEFIRTNINGTHSLLKVARALWLNQPNLVRSHRFHHVSTDEVYGSLRPNDEPFRETTAYSPNSPYSASKAASDHLVRAYHETYGLATTVTNCSNNYGPYQFPEKLIPLTIVNILLGKALPVYGDGLQVRDWLHVADHCESIVLALERGEPGEVYNVGGGGETPNIEVVRSLCALVDHELMASQQYRERFPSSPVYLGGRASDLISHVQDRQGHDRRYAVNFSKAVSKLGYSPSLALGRGLLATVKWYLEQSDWWQKINRAVEFRAGNL